MDTQIRLFSQIIILIILGFLLAGSLYSAIALKILLVVVYCFSLLYSYIFYKVFKKYVEIKYSNIKFTIEIPVSDYYISLGHQAFLIFAGYIFYLNNFLSTYTAFVTVLFVFISNYLVERCIKIMDKRNVN